MDNINNPFNDWLVKISKETPPSSIIAFNFGIFENEEGYVVYLSGSCDYDPENDDWACNDDYTPNEKYFYLSSEFSEKKEEEIIEKVIEWVKQFLILSKTSFLDNAKAITVGFDDGDLTLIK